MNLYFRTAKLEDLPILYEFEQGIITAERPFDETFQEESFHYYDLKKMIEADQTEVLVAMYDNEIVGSGYADIRESLSYLKHSKHAYVGFMYVKPEYRGYGISPKIIEKLKNWAIDRGVHELSLDVYSDNDSAIRAYEKAGLKKHKVNMRMTI